MHAFSALARAMQMEREVMEARTAGESGGGDAACVQLSRELCRLGRELSQALVEGAAKGMGAQVVHTRHSAHSHMQPRNWRLQRGRVRSGATLVGRSPRNCLLIPVLAMTAKEIDVGLVQQLLPVMTREAELVCNELNWSVHTQWIRISDALGVELPMWNTLSDRCRGCLKQTALRQVALDILDCLRA